MDALVTDLHAVNSALVDGGFGPQLLCTLVAFSDESHRRLVARLPLQARHVLPVRAAPAAANDRDNALELQVKGVLGEDLRIEQDMTRWFPVWGAPACEAMTLASVAAPAGRNDRGMRTVEERTTVPRVRRIAAGI